MPQDYNPAFDGDDFMATTMTEVIDENCETLRSKFSELDASMPAQRREFQWWVEWLTSGPTATLKIRNSLNTEWISMYDIENELFIFATPGNITTTDIHDDARKPSLVDGEAISPSSCTLNASAIGRQIAMPQADEKILTKTALSYVGSTGTWLTKYSTSIFIPFTPSTTSTFYARALINRLDARFTIGGLTSNVVSEAGSTPTWHEMTRDISTLPSSGWYDFVFQVFTLTSLPTTDRYTGLSSHLVP